MPGRRLAHSHTCSSHCCRHRFRPISRWYQNMFGEYSRKIDKNVCGLVDSINEESESILAPLPHKNDQPSHHSSPLTYKHLNAFDFQLALADGMKGRREKQLLPHSPSAIPSEHRRYILVIFFNGFSNFFQEQLSSRHAHDRYVCETDSVWSLLLRWTLTWHRIRIFESNVWPRWGILAAILVTVRFHRSKFGFRSSTRKTVVEHHKFRFHLPLVICRRHLETVSLCYFAHRTCPACRSKWIRRENR